MRYVRILLLNFEHALEYRSRSFIWFLIALLNPLFYFVFWKGALSNKGSVVGTIGFSDIASYYFLLVIAGSFLLVHIEEDVAYWDIQQGGLSRYLTKPFSYFRIKFFEELPWRIVQGIFGAIAFVILTSFLGSFVSLTHDWLVLILAIFSSVIAYLLSYTYKMILGISTLWFTDYSGLQQMSTVVLFIFAGFVLPIPYLPEFLQRLALVLPFAYMIYFPVRAFQGLLPIWQLVTIICIQLLWLLTLFLIYKFLWRKGVKEFAGIGQ